MKDSFLPSFLSFLFSFLFKTGFLRVTALAVLELSLQTRLASNSQTYSCLCLLSDGTKDMYHHCLYYF